MFYKHLSTMRLGSALSRSSVCVRPTTCLREPLDIVGDGMSETNVGFRRVLDMKIHSTLMMHLREGIAVSTRGGAIKNSGEICREGQDPLRNATQPAAVQSWRVGGSIINTDRHRSPSDGSTQHAATVVLCSTRETAFLCMAGVRLKHS